MENESDCTLASCTPVSHGTTRSASVPLERSAKLWRDIAAGNLTVLPMLLLSLSSTVLSASKQRGSRVGGSS